MVDYVSRKAKSYMDKYREEIKWKFLENQKTKSELIGTLSEKELMSGKKEEIDNEYRLYMKSFVNKLKSDWNFAMYQEKYHEDIQEIRKLLNETAVLAAKKWDKDKKDYITKFFPEAKNAASRWISEWDTFVKNLWNEIKQLKKDEKEKILWSFDSIFQSKESIVNAFRELKDNLKNTSTTDRVEYVAKSLFTLLFISWGIDFMDQESTHLLIKMLGASRFIYWIRNIGKRTKEAVITGSEHKIDNALRSYKHH